jgi:hypothetical protein
MVTEKELREHIKDFYLFASERLKLKEAPEVLFREDQKNSEDFFGKTGYYDPEEKKIVLYVTNRHAKDIVRSFAHELVHHAQNERGEFKKSFAKDAGEIGYAQKNKGLRRLEAQAFKEGNLIFRDYTDSKKQERGDLNESKNITENNNMKKSLLVEKVVARVVERIKKLKKEELKNPDKADLDNDGKLSGYEKKRGAAIEKSMASDKKGDVKKEAQHDAKKDAQHRTAETDKNKKHLSECLDPVANDTTPHAKEIVKEQVELYKELLKKFNIKKG